MLKIRILHASLHLIILEMVWTCLKVAAVVGHEEKLVITVLFFGMDTRYTA